MMINLINTHNLNIASGIPFNMTIAYFSRLNCSCDLQHRIRSYGLNQPYEQGNAHSGRAL